MRSQVQVLAGPPHQHRRSQHCRQRAGSVRCRLGPRWGRTPIPAGPSPGPSGSAHPAVRLGDDHTAWSSTQPRTAATRHAATSRCSLLPCPKRSRPRGRSERRPGLPGRSAGKRGRRGPHPTRWLGSASHLPLTNATWAASPASRPPRPSIEPSTARQPPGPTRPGGQGRRPPRPGPHRQRLSGKVTDASGRTAGQRTAGRWMGGQQTAERRTLWTTAPGDRTPDGRTA
jgi:hypothetical protein